VLPDPEPDAAEKTIRFGCGIIAGAVLTFLAVLQGALAHGGTSLVLGIVVAITSGFLARRFGNAFWYRLLELLRWW
jgi:hypothetical protein